MTTRQAQVRLNVVGLPRGLAVDRHVEHHPRCVVRAGYGVCNCAALSTEPT